MNTLVYHPTQGIGVVDEHYTYTPISKVANEVYNPLFTSGVVVTDVVVWKDYVFYGEPTETFWLSAGSKLPDNLPIKVDESTHECRTWSKEVINSLPPDCKVITAPPQCLGETWAITEEVVTLSDITGDGYCIEHNWEKRGEYWIIDCIPRKKRLIHSDILHINEECSIG